MTRLSSSVHQVSVLTVQVATYVVDFASWPAVTFLVDGREVRPGSEGGWAGFSPREMLCAESPLLPVDGGRRVAVLQCSCGTPGCGVVAPCIVPSPDGSQVSWTDARDYVGVFEGPTSSCADTSEGLRLPLPDLHFDRAQYVTEIERAIKEWGR